MLFLEQCRFELLKLFARKRSYIGFGVFLVMELLVLLLLSLPSSKAHLRQLIEGNGFRFEDYYSGTTVAMFMLLWTVNLLGSLFFVMVAGYLMAGEVEDGTMRMIFCRPVSRVRVVLIKYLTLMFYTFVLVGTAGATALAAGLALRGYGYLFVFAPEPKVIDIIPSVRGGLVLYACAMPLAALCMTAVGSLGFLFSCCNMKPAAAGAAALSIIVGDIAVRDQPALESYLPYLPVTHLSAWLHVYDYYIPWPRMMEDYFFIAGFNVTCVILGAAIFLRRDLK